MKCRVQECGCLYASLRKCSSQSQGPASADVIIRELQQCVCLVTHNSHFPTWYTAAKVVGVQFLIDCIHLLVHRRGMYKEYTTATQMQFVVRENCRRKTEYIKIKCQDITLLWNKRQKHQKRSYRVLEYGGRHC